MPPFRQAGIKVIHKAVTVRHALKAQSLGVDAVSIDGLECAGHPGDDDIPGLVLIPAVAKKLEIPIIASGGFATGAGLVAALALGACAVNMGTRFQATLEAPAHPNLKEQIVANSELDTTLVFREFRNTARVARNAVSEEIKAIGSRPGATFDDVANLASGARARTEVLGGGNVDGGMWWARQPQGLIDSVESCQVVVDSIVAEAKEIIDKRLSAQLS